MMFSHLKKIVTPIGLVLVFFGLSAWTLYSAESTFSPFPQQASTPPTGLTADIAANTTPPDSTAGTDTTATDQAGTPNAPEISAASATVTTDPANVPDVSATETQAAPPPVEAPTQIFVQPTDPSVPPPATSTASTGTVAVTATPIIPVPPPGVPVVQNVALSSSAEGLTIPYDESNFTADQNWHSTWGTLDVTPSGSLHLAAGPDSTGGAVYLNNSGGWANYTFTATIDWRAGKVFSLMADYRDASNYVSCEYRAGDPGTATMQLKEYRGGIEILLTPAVSISVDNSTGADANASMTINGIHGTCSYNGQSTSNAGAGPGISPLISPLNGAIGFAIHDPSPNVSDIIIKEVKVSQ